MHKLAHELANTRTGVVLGMTLATTACSLSHQHEPRAHADGGAARPDAAAVTPAANEDCAYYIGTMAVDEVGPVSGPFDAAPFEGARVYVAVCRPRPDAGAGVLSVELAPAWGCGGRGAYLVGPDHELTLSVPIGGTPQRLRIDPCDPPTTAVSSLSVERLRVDGALGAPSSLSFEGAAEAWVGDTVREAHVRGRLVLLEDGDAPRFRLTPLPREKLLPFENVGFEISEPLSVPAPRPVIAARGVRHEGRLAAGERWPEVETADFSVEHLVDRSGNEGEPRIVPISIFVPEPIASPFALAGLAAAPNAISGALVGSMDVRCPGGPPCLAVSGSRASFAVWLRPETPITGVSIPVRLLDDRPTDAATDRPRQAVVGFLAHVDGVGLVNAPPYETTFAVDGGAPSEGTFHAEFDRPVDEVLFVVDVRRTERGTFGPADASADTRLLLGTLTAN